MSNRYKTTPELKAWGKLVKERDGNKCVICGSTFKPNAHHLIVRENELTKFDINNGLTLCPKHHLFCRKISAHNNPLGLYIWLAKNRQDQLNYVGMKMEEILKDLDINED
jgi:hypothetical protein